MQNNHLIETKVAVLRLEVNLPEEWEVLLAKNVKNIHHLDGLEEKMDL